jgi:hypothetical protein
MSIRMCCLCVYVMSGMTTEKERGCSGGGCVEASGGGVWATTTLLMAPKRARLEYDGPVGCLWA